MNRSFVGSLRLGLISFSALALSAASALAGSVTITSPAQNSTLNGKVLIAASSMESAAFHLELWDNGIKLANVQSGAVNATFPMTQGKHTLSVLAVSNSGVVLDKSSVAYAVVAPTESASTGVVITKPASGSVSTNAVKIAASAKLSTAFHLEISDNGYKLGQVLAESVEAVYVLPNGGHVLTVEAVTDSGTVISRSSVTYKVAEACVNSRNVQCDLDQLPIDNAQNNCSPKIGARWVANSCGDGVQGVNPTNPISTSIEAITEGGSLPDQGNLTLNGHAVHFSETQGTSHPSNVLFRGQSPTTTPAGAIDSHWVLDEYVHLPDPTAHQAYEMDAQYTAGGIWTKFYTECAFNHSKGTGFWAVFDSNTGGWIYLNGLPQGGQTPPLVPCNRSQFMQPWAGSSNPSFSGWHHVSWSFLRNSDGTVTFQSVTVDGATTMVNFKPHSATGGKVSDSGYFSALVQLDGVVNSDGKHDTVDAYVSEISLTHTP
jgi:hypothetical protein